MLQLRIGKRHVHNKQHYHNFTLKTQYKFYQKTQGTQSTFFKVFVIFLMSRLSKYTQ